MEQFISSYPCTVLTVQVQHVYRVKFPCQPPPHFHPQMVKSPDCNMNNGAKTRIQNKNTKLFNRLDNAASHFRPMETFPLFSSLVSFAESSHWHWIINGHMLDRLGKGRQGTHPSFLLFNPILASSLASHFQKDWYL